MNRAARTLVLIAFAVLLVSASVSSATVVSYTSNKNFPVSTTYSLTVNGTPVIVNACLEHNFCRFAMDGEVTVALTSTSNLTSVTINPRLFQIPTTISGTTCTFTLKRPRKVRIDVNGTLGALYLFADPIEVNAPKLGDANVKNLMDFTGVDSTGRTVSTAGIQAALDWVGTNYTTKPILFVPDGLYRSATINIKSNTTLYLSPGAVLRGTADDQGYTSNGFVCLSSTNYAKIMGRGIIQGNGYECWTNGTWPTGGRYCIYGSNANYAEVRDVTMVDPNNYYFIVMSGHNYLVTNVKEYRPRYNGNPEGNVDGIHMGGYNNVFENSFIATLDDALCFGSSHDCLMNDIVLDNYRASCIRHSFGGGAYNVTFSNIYVTDNAAWHLFLADIYPGYPWSATPAHNLMYENWYAEGANTEAIMFNLYDPSASGVFHDLHFRNITMVANNALSPDMNDAGLPATIVGGAASRTLSRFYWGNLNIAAKYCTTATAANIHIGNYVDSIYFYIGAKEAEDMTLTNYAVESNTNASNGKLVKLTGATGSVKYNFQGESGAKDIMVWYYDETGGSTPYTLSVAGAQKGAWTANANLADTAASAWTRTYKEFYNVQVNSGDEIRVDATQTGAEGGRIDRIDVFRNPGFAPYATQAIESPRLGRHDPGGSSAIATSYGKLTLAALGISPAGCHRVYALHGRLIRKGAVGLRPVSVSGVARGVYVVEWSK